MSTLPRLSTDRDKSRRKSCHRSNNSGELDVFTAESYFSSNGTTLMHELGMMAIRDDCNTRNRQQGWREGRVSLDIPSMKYTTTSSHHYHHHHHHHYHRQHSVTQPPQDKDVIKKHRQPSSPGGKLASFFNSLITHAVSKKKKIPKLPSSEQESPNNWRKLKINNFSGSTTRTTNTNSDPYPINTPTKTPYKNLFSKSRCKNINPNTKANSATQVLDLEWLDEKLKCIGVLSSSDQKQSSNKGFDRQRCSLDKERSLIGRNSSAETGINKRFKEEDGDGGESDSSSDLFELQLNYEYCSSGLPVYETTCVDTIKRSSNI
ncbi:hypothetical protein V2J09_015334 [Rumex salicifolius]